MKKCIVLKDMANPINNLKWIKYRIRNRYLAKVIPFFGTYVQLEYPF